MLKGVAITYNTDRATRVSWELCTLLTLASDPPAILCHTAENPFFPYLLLSIPPSHSSVPDTLSEFTGTAWQLPLPSRAEEAAQYGAERRPKMLQNW